MIEKAYAKLNLSLDVLGKLPNGYHEVRMIMQTIEFGDDVDIELTDGEFFIDSGKPYLPNDDRNLALRAAKAFLAGSGKGARIHITKRTPTGAGMGGGSADAAAVLRALNILTEKKYNEDELCEIGQKIGSDIPFCVRGGTCLAEETGMKLSRLPSLPYCHIVVAKPAFSISTEDLYKKIDSRKSRIHPDTNGILTSLEKQDLSGLCHRMYNVFEDVLGSQASSIQSIKTTLLKSGAMSAIMTGTGSAVYGIFSDFDKAKKCYNTLSESFNECYLTKPWNPLT